jgi:hypothetical protein
MPAHKLSTDAERHSRHVDRLTTPDGCWLWTGAPQRNGYGMFSSGSRAEGTFKMGGAHPFALQQALGRPLLPGMQALHTCDVRACCRNEPPGFYEVNGIMRPCYGHLWEGTTQDNTTDRHAKGRSASGARNGVYLHPERYPREPVLRLRVAFHPPCLQAEPPSGHVCPPRSHLSFSVKGETVPAAAHRHHQWCRCHPPRRR